MTIRSNIISSNRIHTKWPVRRRSIIARSNRDCSWPRRPVDPIPRLRSNNINNNNNSKRPITPGGDSHPIKNRSQLAVRMIGYSSLSTTRRPRCILPATCARWRVFQLRMICLPNRSLAFLINQLCPFAEWTPDQGRSPQRSPTGPGAIKELVLMNVGNFSMIPTNAAEENLIGDMHWRIGMAMVLKDILQVGNRELSTAEHDSCDPELRFMTRGYLVRKRIFLPHWI